MLKEETKTSTVCEYMKENDHFFQQPIVKRFLENKANVSLLQSALEDGNQQADEMLNRRFQEFFLKARMAKYIDKLCRLHALSFEKKHRIQQSQLLLDQPTDHEKGQTLIQKIPDCHHNPNTTLECLEEVFTDKRLYDAYQQLGERTKVILQDIFIHQLTTYEIAEKLGCSQQNVSKLKSLGLKKLREAITDE
ncbi:sigma-70 family RNA polymerase sigma factor [Evansella clarkii]|uniref:sigma-70 family RNA polymerase sigma factor n=1 Tax=Evansella clarkii TaxID=79879 RepID=UPI0009985AB9|nr:sigma-70 family RNA polymerase sigma factor [Evansella clarkii]